MHVHRQATIEVGRAHARAGFEKDLLFRRWNAMHGGVYVPVTERTPANPRLNVPERDIKTPSGRQLTLVNPAYMTRQVHELGAETNGIQGHITSLTPIRPENAADAWETAALEGFEHGNTEYSSIEVFCGEPHLRLMRPLRTEKGCLKCHGHQGYKEGDIRGGISVSVPMAPLWAIGRAATLSAIGWHGLFWFLGLGGIGLFHRHQAKHARQVALNEEQARESEKRFMDVLHSSDDAILLIDGETFVECNEATARMLEYSCRDEFLMTHPSALSPPEQPDGRASFEKAQEMMQTAFEKGFHRFEWMHRKAGGEDFPVEVTLTAITYHRKSILHCLWRDLTQQKRADVEREQSQKTMEKILESMPVGVVIIGTDKTIRHANSAALAMMGHDSDHEILGCECHQTLCPAQKYACPILDLRKKVDNAERVLIDKNKKEIPILKTVIPITLNGEDVLLETFVDISVRKHAEQALKAAKKEAETANRTKSQFLASMSHELRTPLTGILGFADLLLGSAADEEQQREYLQTIRSSGHHLLELINDILDLSKIEAARLDVERAPCAPHGILNDVISIMRAQAQAKGLDLRCRWSGSVPGVIKTDEARLRQILMNLVGNAVKFTHQGGVEVVARLERSGRGHKLLVSITDSGIGIPEEKLQTIFEPFAQADNSVTREFGGTGLGLAISARLARALGGDVTVTSELGVGSTFTVSVDAGDLEGVQMLASPPADGMQAGQEEPRSGISQFRPGSALLVEDGHINRKLVSTVLEKAGLSVSTAENGEVGVELATRNHFDLILMDMQMPVLDGYAATRKLRDLGCTTPIIALTAHAMKGDKEKCLAAGCSRYVSKPVAIDTLLAAVAEALGRKNDAGSDAVSVTPSDYAGSALVSSLPTEEPVFREIVREFVEYLDQLLSEMRQAAAEKDVARLAELAHTLKGSAGTAGFGAFTEPARELEMLAKKRRLDAFGPAISELAELAARILVPTETCDAAS